MNDEQKNTIKTEKELQDELNQELGNMSDANFEDIDIVASTEDGEALPTKDIVKKLREDVKKLQKEKEEYLTGWQRAKADYVNLQKELDEARIYISNLTKEKIVEKLMPSLDSFELAFQDKANWEKVDENWRAGMTSIYKQIISALKNSGIERIEDAGLPFNPLFHESIKIDKTNDSSKDHFVSQIFQVGYKIGDKAIRPAKVSIFEFEG
jgi:molecular chaperone GrpE